MSDDERAIRDLVIAWQRASAAGDLKTLLLLMDDDAVFLTHGQLPMRGKETSAAAFQKALQHFRIESASEIQEIHVAGELAFCWGRLVVTLNPLAGGQPKRRHGDTLTVLRKNSGDWVIYRDANMLAPEPDA
jgi:uncharacterized protein (TIGR02246 family)